MFGFAKHHWFGIGIIFLILIIALFGNVKIPQRLVTPEEKLQLAQKQAENIQKQIASAEKAKTQSVYSGTVSLSNVNRNTNPSQEYLAIQVSRNSKTNVLISGWKIASLSSGASVSIPKGTYLFYSNTQNGQSDIVLAPGDKVVVGTGTSPNGTNFKLNKCSGYLTQFQSYTPGISIACPLAKNEDLSKIPRYVSNDACFDYIDTYQRCKIQTAPLPIAWSPECRAFITNLNYTSCVNTHRNDKDFYLPEWRVFLARSQSLWKTKRESIVLYDADGKIVDTLNY